MENNLSKAYAEVLLILSYMEQKYIDMIPKKLLELFDDEKDKNYQPNIIPNISLAEQNLQRKTLALLAMLNLNYWCEDEKEKQELIAIYAENDRKKEEELREKYNPDDIFKNKQKILTTIQDTNLSIEIRKENFIIRLINYIKELFNRK